MMRKSLWIVLVLLLIAAIGAPNASADTLFRYAYTLSNTLTQTPYTISWTTEPIPVVTMDTILGTAALAAASCTGSFVGCSITSVELDAGNAGNQVTYASFGNDLGVDGFPLADYSIAGTYTATNQVGSPDTLVVTAVQTPEPPTVGLMLIGLGWLVLMMRKRIARGLPQAT
jgi:hypothetical protein